MVDTGVGMAIESHPPELHQDCPCRCMDEVASDRYLHHWPIALGDGDEPGRVGALQLVQTDPIGVRHFVRIGTKFAGPR